MEREKQYWFFLLTVAAGWSLVTCRKPYSPPVISGNNDYLVVEGVIAAGSDSTIINLSRTVRIANVNAINPEKGAKMTVDDGQGANYSLIEADKGRYVSTSLNLDNSHRYRLSITTADGQTYVSAYVPVKVTPPIDSVWFRTNSTGVNIYSAAHDPSNNTRYYRWYYTETYVYQADLETKYIFDPTNPDTLKWSRLRTPAEQIHTCYITINTSTININTSAALSSDVIANNLITEIPEGSEKLFHRYSIMVRQYALTQDAYNFWAKLKKNTEQIGTIFDAQPSENTTNLYCISDPSKPVIGYVSASTITQKRIFINWTQVPDWPPYISPLVCRPDFACWPKGSPPQQLLAFGELVPTDTIRSGGCPGIDKPSWTVPAQGAVCVDCRTHPGGKTQKPAFWIDE
ncbi:MAG: DUF4249 domain-containing protein [Bacteroidetes bacterium]|nr:DUF4249 domain-containing protein [Bacteroidota bacterium]